MDSTNTYIKIDIQNNPEILQVIIDTLPYMNGWTAHGSVDINNHHWGDLPNKTARYFFIDIKTKTIGWLTFDCQPPKDKVYRISTEEQISDLLESVYIKSKRY